MCRNNVAPMAATSILCILLPTFRSMELPTNFNSDKTTTEQEVAARSRPAYQSSVWMMIRNCLGRCGESDNFGGSARGGGDGNGDDGSGAKGRGVSHIVVSSYQDGQDGNSMDDSEGYDRAAMDQLLRRRSAHVLRIMIEYERELLLKSAPPKGRKVVNSSPNDNSSDSAAQLAELWTKYVLCFEMLEMEIELHLVDQVWPTMLDLCVACGDGATTNGNGDRSDTLNRLPHLKWGDIMSLLNLVLLSDAPTLRKLGLFRFLSGHAGVANTVPQSKSLEEETKNEDKGKDSVFMKNPKSKYKIKKNSGAKGLVSLFTMFMTLSLSLLNCYYYYLMFFLPL